MAGKSEIVVIEKKNKSIILDTTLLQDCKLESEKESEEVEKYQELKSGIRKLCRIRRLEVVPIVVGAFGAVT